MRIVQITGLRTALASMQWRRGLRAGLAVGMAMLVCHLLHRPMGWAALGGFQVVLVDNGGPYRSRLYNVLAILLGGSAAVGLGVLAGVNLTTALVVSIVFCFAATLARVISQPLAASSVIILVCYIVAYGNPTHTMAAGFSSTAYFLCGGLWASILTLLLWPADPFRPARNAIADAFATLSELVTLLPSVSASDTQRLFNETIGRFRVQIEAALQSVAATPARMTSRTIRARNLAVLNESADLLLARILRLAELADIQDTPAATSSQTAIAHHLSEIATWLSSGLAPIEPALRRRPVYRETALAPEGSFLVDLRRSLSLLEASLSADTQITSATHLATALHDSLLNFEVAYEAIRAIWTGTEPRHKEAMLFRDPIPTRVSTRVSSMLWLDTLRANFSLNSIMFRHALRLAAVVAIDVLLLRFIHITHGYWLAMTSLIVLQPYTGETVRVSSARVAGTVAGGFVAALCAGMVHSPLGIIAVVSIGSLFAVSLYAIDYAWYCFFLTPTIVLMTLPHFRDWHFAVVRMGLTGLGALVAVLAMLLLWPERESLQLPTLLARGAAADAAYLRAMLAFWRASTHSPEARIAAERSLLAPARRLCGLAVNDAEETLDHAFLEHSIPLNPARARTEHLNRAALTFTTYLRRLTQTVTTLAAVAAPDPTGTLSQMISSFATRLEQVSTSVRQGDRLTSALPTAIDASPRAILPAEQLTRLERQVSVLERTANELASFPTP